MDNTNIFQKMQRQFASERITLLVNSAKIDTKFRSILCSLDKNEDGS